MKPVTFLLVICGVVAITGHAGAQVEDSRILLTITTGDGTPVDGALVAIDALGLRALSDKSGRAALTGIPSTAHLLTVRRLGYQTERVMIDFSAGGLVEADIPLRVAPVSIEGVEVTAESRARRLDNSGYYDREKIAMGTFISEELIEQRRHTARGMSDYLRGIRGLKLERSPSGGVIVYNSRGPGSLQGECVVPVFLDGQRVTPTILEAGSRWARERLNIDNLVAVRDVAAIEVYTGAQAPAQFSGGCGAIVVWTRGQ